MYQSARRPNICLMKKIMLLTVLCGSLLALTPGCNRNTLTGSKVTLSNYDQVTNGMTKAQVERIMGPPTTIETKDVLIFKKRPIATKTVLNSRFSPLRTTSWTAKRATSPPDRLSPGSFAALLGCLSPCVRQACFGPALQFVMRCNQHIPWFPTDSALSTELQNARCGGHFVIRM